MTSSDPIVPPLDPELARAMGSQFRTWGRGGHPPTPAEYLAAVGNFDVTDEVLDPAGRVAIRRLEIAVGTGPDVLPALVARLRTGTLGRPCIYYTANGGKIRQGATAGVTAEEIRWVIEHDVVFVSVSPRPGPEYQHPVQVEDAVAGLEWIIDNSIELGVDPDRIIIMGKSGGGGIAASTALYVRDHGGPKLAFQLLVYPMLDDRAVTISSGYEAPGWTPALNRMGWEAILGDSVGGPGVSPYAAAARAVDLSGLPPAYIEVGSSEIFRDEDLNYAMRLAEAGVPVEIHSWMGGFHGFEIMAPKSRLAQQALAARASFVERAVASLCGE